MYGYDDFNWIGIAYYSIVTARPRPSTKIQTLVYSRGLLACLLLGSKKFVLNKTLKFIISYILNKI